MSLPDNLGKYRALDEKPEKGEIKPENETLNNDRVRSYLEENGFTVNNFDSLFTMVNAREILTKGNTAGERKMLETINLGQELLERNDLSQMIEKNKRPNEFRSTLQKELKLKKNENLEPQIMAAYEAFHTIRKLALKTLQVQESFQAARETEMNRNEAGVMDSLKDGLGKLKHNWNKMSGGEKLILGGGAVLGSLWLATTANEKVKKTRDWLWKSLTSLMPLAGGSLVLNYAYKLYDGKQTGWEALSGLFEESGAGSAKSWEAAYNTDAKKAELVRKSTIFLGDMDFRDLAKAYMEAKAKGEKAIHLTTVDPKDMAPEEVYLALDTFFKTYPVEKVEAKYAQSEKRPIWISVVTTEMVEDGRIKVDEGLYNKTVGAVSEYTTRGWNWIWAGEGGIGLSRRAHQWIWGTENPTKEQLRLSKDKLQAQLQNEVVKEADLETFIKQKYNQEQAAGFIKMRNEGTTSDKFPGLKYHEQQNEAIYMESVVNLDVNLSGEKAVQQMVEDTLKKAEDFIVDKYPEIKGNVHKFIDRNRIIGVRVGENNTFRLFIRMPAKGSTEYTRRAVMTTPESSGDEGNADIFSESANLVYEKLLPGEKKQLAIRFWISETKSTELQKICDWYRNKYISLGKTRAEVMRAMLGGSDEERNTAMDETGAQRDLKENANLLQMWEPKLVSAEKEAAAEFDYTMWDALNPKYLFWTKKSDAYEPLMEQMKRNWGYSIRLAILGDAEARKEITGWDAERYDRNTNVDWLKDLVSDYSNKCKELVDKYSKGTLTFEKTAE